MPLTVLFPVAPSCRRILCLLGAAIFFAVDPLAAAPPLFQMSAVPDAAGGSPADVGVTSRQGVSIDETLLARTRPGDVLEFDLPGGLRVDGSVVDVHANARGAQVYAGMVPGRAGARFLIVARRGEIVGNISLPPLGLYELRRSAEGRRELRRVDPRALQKCGAAAAGSPAPLAAPRSGQSQRRADDVPAPALADDGTQFDLMIVYTPAAAKAAGGVAAIETLADLAVEDTNSVYANCHFAIRARLVDIEEIQYTESGSVQTDVDRLRSTDDGYMDGVHAIRDQYNADLVSLWVSYADDFGGYGVFNYDTNADGTNTLDSAGGFTAVVYSQASPNLLAHEIGHNFGCSHDVANALGYIFYPFGYGWRFTGQDGVLYRTIMAYDPGDWIPYFSSPLLFYQGAATGVADVADNARAMNQSAFTVANFRLSAEATPMGGVPFFQGSVPVGEGFYYASPFGYYAPVPFPYIYHDDLEYLYVIDAADGDRGVYLYDFQGLDFLYTSPSLFPYMYYFDQSTFLYYFVGTTNPRVFANLATGQFIYR